MKARDNRSKYCFKSAYHLLFTSTETAGLKIVAVFTTLGNFPCKFSGSTAALGACWEVQEGSWCLRPSSWGADSALLGASLELWGLQALWCHPLGPRAGPSLPLNIDQAVQQEGPPGEVPLLFILCFAPAEFAGRTDGGCKVTDTSGGTGTNLKHPLGKRKKKNSVLFTLPGNISQINSYCYLCKNDNLVVKKRDK